MKKIVFKLIVASAIACLFSGCVVLAPDSGGGNARAQKPAKAKKGSKDPSTVFISVGASPRLGPEYICDKGTACSVDEQAVNTVDDLRVSMSTVHFKVGYVGFKEAYPIFGWRAYVSVDSGSGKTKIYRILATDLEAKNSLQIVAGNIDLMLQLPFPIPGFEGAGLGVYAGLAVGKIKYKDNFYYKDEFIGTKLMGNYGFYLSGSNHMFEFGVKIIPLKEPVTSNESFDPEIFYMAYTYKF